MFKILVVEDDKELNHTVCVFLNDNGYQAVGCLNANEAYDALYDQSLLNLHEPFVSRIRISRSSS